MPWKVYETNGQYCVHKLTAEGGKGKQVACHASEAEASAQMKALYANAESERGLRTGYFATLADLRESTLDESEFVARGVTLIRPGFSTNTDKAGRPRYYSADMLKASAGIFEGTRAFANHPRRSDEKDLPERDVRDISGYYENVTAADDGRLMGDFRVVGQAREWLWPLIAETARKPDLVQLSINALGKTRIGEAEGRKAIIIEAIEGANSVDVVTTGAAGGSFAGALLQSDGETFTRDLLAAMSFDEWREARPEFMDRLKTEWKTVRETEELKTARTELEETNDRLAELEEAHRALTADLGTYRRAESADRLLSESNLPLKLRAAVRAELVAEADEAGMQRVIERERAKYAATPRPPVPISGAGQRVSGADGNKTHGQRPNPAAELLGIEESRLARPGETAEEYRARRLKEAQSA